MWRRQPKSFFEEAIVDLDGSIAPTDGECKQGIFGINATKNLIKIAEKTPDEAWQRLGRPAKYEVKTKPRGKREKRNERDAEAAGQPREQLDVPRRRVPRVDIEGVDGALA